MQHLHIISYQIVVDRGNLGDAQIGQVRSSSTPGQSGVHSRKLARKLTNGRGSLEDGEHCYLLYE